MARSSSLASSSPMPAMVRTVAGDVAADALGTTLVHEALLLGLPGWELDSTLRFDPLDAFERVRRRLVALREAGGAAIVDAGGLASGRRPALLLRLAAASGVHVVAATGFRDERFTPGLFLPLAGADPERLARLFADEIRLGMVPEAGVPFRRRERSSARAGLIRVGHSAWPMTPAERTHHVAAAIASRETGAPIYATSGPEPLAVLELLVAAGATPERVIVGARDRLRADPAGDLELAEHGAYVAYDHVGWEAGAVADDQRAELVSALIDAGHAQRLLLSSGAVSLRVDGRPAPPHDHAHVLTRFLPKLRERGVSARVLDTITRVTPGRALALRPAERSVA